MERVKKEENQKSRTNRIISYCLVVISFVLLMFCVSEIIKYVIYVNKNATLTSDLETLKQDSNYLREHFDVLRNDEYYSVYIDGDYQYVDSRDDSISIIK